MTGTMVAGTVLLVLALAAALTAAVGCGVAAWTTAGRADRADRVTDCVTDPVTSHVTSRVAGRVTGGVAAHAARLGPGALVLSAAAAAAAAAHLEVALLRGSAALPYAARVTDPDMPAYYRATAMWSALEGSLLLWLLALASAAAIATATARRLDPGQRATVLAVLAAVVAMFGVISLLASPFTATAGAGAAPSPLLRDHAAMGVHPPLLYAGFAALAVPYALSVAALAGRRLPRGWAATTRAWNLGAWILLTAGVALGAWWSYAVLGWGGYWAWDPVENASLLPWLASTALVHSVGPRTRGGHWSGWAVTLSGLAFVLVVLAQLLTRSGIVESVHAFTTSTLGPALAVSLGAVAVPWAVLLVVRGRSRAGVRGGSPARHGIRGTALDGQRTVLTVVLVVVATGTLLPTVLLLATGERFSVGPPWYQRTLAPFALLLLVLLAAAPWLSVRPRPPHPLLPGAAGAAACCAVGVVVRDPALAVVSGLAAFTVVAGARALRPGPARVPDRRAAGSWLAHTGVALGAVAVVAGSHGSVQEGVLTPGEALTAGDTTVTLVRLDRDDDAGRRVAEAELLIGRDGQLTGTARPELRWYPDHATMLAGPDIHGGAVDDVYVTLLDADPASGTATVRLAVTPLVGWLWAAAGLAVAGGLVAGVPGRRRTPPRVRLRRIPSTPAAARVLTVLLLPVLTSGLVGCAPVRGEPAPAPPLAGEGLDGDRYDVADLRGSVVLVAAWASWCAPCHDEMPLLEDAAQRYEDDGLEVLGINVRDLPGPARRFTAEHDVSFPSVVDPRGTMSVAWGLRGLPATYLVDRDGNLVARHPGPATQEWIDTVVLPEVRR
ncbi:cytochrome c-type biogenesis CcmF C-terminal domain-containing protein [Myceligenerans pegani]|uniref:Cytochrome c biogenesis protein CcsA n=1 Tax=Myceligenerans pegani TaxID=2776917 RepID=A0ABR9MV50_9MICO|nr:cytochrome c-type biogenesis CcmF C-terminal domain-containing protein [Myceligenerans sp. TRM 65318]MBE1874881.1 cytochrome c biogenesis protein CcsA [Myceligenerans sp. TRM 65318]MBE3017152.1 cytochrome c biogenesis protein CcsA [Myceligenerans sp. TRM 65318]